MSNVGYTCTIKLNSMLIGILSSLVILLIQNLFLKNSQWQNSNAWNKNLLRVCS